MLSAMRSSVRRLAAARATNANTSVRLFSTKSEAELAMQKSLTTQLEATHVNVVDVSGGCGSMFNVEVVSPQFEGVTRVKQHRMVNEVLKDEIKGMHGLTIRTMTPEQFANKQ